VTAPRPTFFIVGAAKCGTTSLSVYLGAHPEAWIPPEKELRYFDRDHAAHSLDWYRGYFAGAGDARAIGEATPTYMADRGAIARMAQAFPQARLIAMLRDPTDRAYSHYWHWRSRMGECREFADVVDGEIAQGRATEPGTWDAQRPERYRYLMHGRYLPQLEALCEHFPRDALHVVLFDDLQANPAGTFRAVCRHLGIDDSTVPADVGTVANAYQYYAPAWLWALFVRIRIGRWIPGRAAAALYRAMVRTEDPYPPMDPGVAARLRAYYAPDNAELGAWLGRDLSRWDAGAAAPGAPAHAR
jgi:hypothetical protein